MATDSTELTFVRCPSCRSLVPAVSTRCRMCGATLEASAQPTSEADQEKRASRVRQRTMSGPQDDLHQHVDRVRAEAANDGQTAPIGRTPIARPTQLMGAVSSEILVGASAEEPSSPVQEEVQEDEVSEAPTSDDPLQAYIEEVEVPVEEPSAPIGSKSGAPQTAAFGAASAGPELLEVEEEVPASAPEAEKAIPLEAPKPAPAESVDEGPRVVVESGPRRGRGNLSFGKPAEKPAEQRERPERASQETPAAQRSEQSQRSQPASASARADLGGGESRRRDEPARAREEAPRGKGRVTAEQVAARPQPARAAAPKVEGQSGRLFGWLVSYSEDDGLASELREGKFFVTSRSLKGNDFVIEDRSVSTPHALVHASVEQGLVVQDLMSERGVFVRRRERGAYERIDEAVTLSHGDWVRFGDVEFLVSLVPYVGEA